VDVIKKGQKSRWWEEISFRHKQFLKGNRRAKTSINRRLVLDNQLMKKSIFHFFM
jgi:hypothetical protein